MSALFTPDPLWRNTTSYFFKTSMDYVLCTNEGRPLLAIDFDGMGRGFDRDGEYVQIEATKDRYRKSKFDFKLRYAIDNGFPYHIVASEEFNYLGDGIEFHIGRRDCWVGVVKTKFCGTCPCIFRGTRRRYC